MKFFLIVTSHENKFIELTDELARQGAFEFIWAASLQEALNALSVATPDFVIIDEEINGTPGLTIARDILMKNAIVNQAVISNLSSDEFHDTAECLGIMAQLSLVPDASQAKNLIDTLKKMP